MRESEVSLTGIQPTGQLHLGNYLGAVRPSVERSRDSGPENFYFIANYHALNSVRDPRALRELTLEVAASWLAAGLGPRAHLYRQSDLPEVLEFQWILSCVANKGTMNRAHSYKAKVQDNLQNGRDPDQGVNMGLYNYPILMASDILLLGADVVPIGPDQKQHLEMACDLAQAFNYYYGDLLTLPRALFREGGSVMGLDGRKMSKSYGNTIPLFGTEKELKKLLGRIKTDSSSPTDPKDPATCPLYSLFERFASRGECEELAASYKKGIGWGAVKGRLFEVINDQLAGPRERYFELMAHPQEVEEVLLAGAHGARARARGLLYRVRQATGVE